MYLNKGLKMTWIGSKHVAHESLTTRIKVVVFDCLNFWLICKHIGMVFTQSKLHSLAERNMRFLNFVSVDANFLSFFLSFFLMLISFYLHILGVEGYCCIWSQSVTHTNTCWSPLDDGSAHHRDLYLLTHNTHDIHDAGEIRTRNPRNRATADVCPRRRGHWDRQMKL